MYPFLVFIFCTTVSIECQLITVNVNISQVFVFKITPEMLSWNDRERENDFHFAITSMEGPDLPHWLYTKYFKRSNSLYIFGAPPKDINLDKLELQISITNLFSYRVKYCKLIISIFNEIEDIKYEIHIRINNIKIEDMLNEDRQNTLIEIFENHFWKDSKGKLYITFLASSEDLGFRLPLSPNDTSGVVVHLGSMVNFSTQLIDLQNETIPLSKHCPSFYKRITVERFFRPKFIIDWCYFKLVSYNDCLLSGPLRAEKACDSSKNNTTNFVLKNDEDLLIDKEKLPESQFLRVLILLVFIPSILLAFCIVSWLTSFMCLNHAKLNDPYSDDYFETVFYICEDCIRINEPNEEYLFGEEDLNNKETYYHF